MTSGNDLAYYNYTYTYGDSYTENEDGTYTINNPSTIERKDWYTEYSNVKNKYVCKNATNNTCSDWWYTLSPTSVQSFSYIKGDDVSNAYKYAKDFEYKIDPEDGTYKYFLKADSTVSFWDIAANQESFNNAHYTCFNVSGKCTEISYVYHLTDDGFYYINIKNGKNVEEDTNEMLYNDDVNTVNSTIKTGIDLWYEKYLLRYSDYLEDIIFCNARSQNNADTNGWNPNGGNILTIMRFYYYGSKDLSCPNTADQFSTSNSKAKLKYKVGLMSYSEMSLSNNHKLQAAGQSYWYGSPVNAQYSEVSVMTSVSSIGLYNSSGVRPAISLKSDTEYVDGDGSMAHPYIVDTDS